MIYLIWFSRLIRLISFCIEISLIEYALRLLMDAHIEYPGLLADLLFFIVALIYDPWSGTVITILSLGFPEIDTVCLSPLVFDCGLVGL